MKKSSVFLSTLLVLFFCFNAYGQSQYNVSEEVLDAAEKGIEFAKTRISSNPEAWGFDNIEEVNNLTLGEAMKVYYVDLEKLMKSKNEDLLTLTNEPNVWEFTTYSNYTPKILLTIGYEDGEYRVTCFGGDCSDLHTTLSAAEEFKKLKENTNPSVLVKAGFNSYIITTINNDEFCFEVEANDNSRSANNSSNNPKSSKQVIDFLKYKQANGSEGSAYGSGFSTSQYKMERNNSYITIVLCTICTFMVIIGGYSLVKKYKSSRK